MQESGEGFGTLAEAVAAIGGGSGTILIAPGTYRQCAVQNGGRIAYVARAPGTVVFDGVACEGKAALVLGGRSARVEGLIFQNIRVPDANGAGIRLEAGDLIVRESLFRDGENGILVANDHERHDPRRAVDLLGPRPAARKAAAARIRSTIAAAAASSSPAPASSAAPAAIISRAAAPASR